MVWYLGRSWEGKVRDCVFIESRFETACLETAWIGLCTKFQHYLLHSVGSTLHHSTSTKHKVIVEV